MAACLAKHWPLMEFSLEFSGEPFKNKRRAFKNYNPKCAASSGYSATAVTDVTSRVSHATNVSDVTSRVPQATNVSDVISRVQHATNVSDVTSRVPHATTESSETSSVIPGITVYRYRTVSLAAPTGNSAEDAMAQQRYQFCLS